MSGGVVTIYRASSPVIVLTPSGAPGRSAATQLLGAGASDADLAAHIQGLVSAAVAAITSGGATPAPSTAPFSRAYVPVLRL